MCGMASRVSSMSGMMMVLMVIVMHGRVMRIERMMCCRRRGLHAQAEAPVQILREAPHDADINAYAHGATGSTCNHRRCCLKATYSRNRRVFNLNICFLFWGFYFMPKLALLRVFVYGKKINNRCALPSTGSLSVNSP